VHLRPHERVILVAIVAVMGAGAVLGVLSARSRAPSDGLRRLTNRLEPIARELAAVSEHLHQGTADFFDAIATSDAAGRTKLVQGSEAEQTQAQKAWTRYLRLALGLPREARLQQAFEDEQKRSTDLAISIFATDPQAQPLQYAAQTAQLRASGEKQQHALSELANSLYAPMIRRSEARALAGVDRLHDETVLVLAIAVAVGLAITALVLRGAVRDERVSRALEVQRERQIRRSDLEFRVQRGLEMARTEEDSYGVIGSAIGHVIPGYTVELLIADSSRAHFRQVLSAGPQSHACAVSAPTACPVGQSGQVRTFESSRAIDACPFLRQQCDAACAAACVPVAIAGRPIGVIHVAAGENELPSDEAISGLTLVAQRAGAHIGLLRATARTETQARTDSLTGLYNRRSIEAAAHHLVREGTPFVVAFADLDEFKTLNDKHGHETGDRALRLFARVLRDSVRPTDIPARYGGEEFVVVLPDCSVADAMAVAERLRGRLEEALQSAAVPPFTISIGIARSGPDNGLTETVGRADEALLSAKAAGRNRIHVFPGDEPADGDQTPPPGAQLDTTAHDEPAAVPAPTALRRPA